MRKPWEIVQYFQTLPRNSPIRKTILLEEAEKDNIPLFEGFNLAFNQNIIFNMKSIPEPHKDGPGLSHIEFMKEAIEIAGSNSRNTKLKKIVNLFHQATLEEWYYWYKPILTKSLKCGVNRYMITRWLGKEYPEFVIEDFSCQGIYNKKVNLNIISGMQVIEPAFGGFRTLLTLYPSSRVQMRSSIGVDCERLYTHIISQFEQIAHTIRDPIVFDGICKEFGKKERSKRGNTPKPNAIFYIFDIIPLEYFEKRIYNIPLLQRKDLLHNWFERNPQLTQIKEMDYKLCDFSTPQGRVEFKKISEQYVTDGNSHVLVKAGNSPYECRVPMKWILHRPERILTLEIVTMEEHPNYSGMLHCMHVKGMYNGFPIKAKVNLGFTDEQRYEFMYDWNIIGKKARISAPVLHKKVGEYTIENASFIELIEETK